MAEPRRRDTASGGHAGTQAVRGHPASRSRSAAVLALIAVAVYLPGFWWGAPRAQNEASIRSWGVDDEAPIGPLAQIHNIIEPKDVQNLGYPLMHSFMVATAYAPYLAFQWATGDFREPTGEYPYGLSDPIRTLQVLTWLAHLLSVLLGAAVVYGATRAAECLWGVREAWWAGTFTMLSFPMFYYARTGNVDVPALCFISLALVPFVGLLREGMTVRRGAWLGLWAGFALATKETSGAVFFGMPFVLLWIAWSSPEATEDGWGAFWKMAGAGLLAALLAFGFGSGLFVDPARYLAHLEFARGRIALLKGGEVPYMTYYERDLAGNVALARLLGRYLLEAVTVPGVLLATIGIIHSIRRRDPGAWLVTPVATYLFVLWWSARNGQLRYVMPAALVLSIFAARGVTLLLGEGRETGSPTLDAADRRGAPWHPVLRWVAAGAVGWILLAGSLRAADLTWQMISDSRYQATAWLEARLDRGDRVDFFGPDAKLPWMPLGVRFERANEYLGAIYPPRRGPQDAARIRARWASVRPDVILVMPDVSSREREPHNATLPPEVYDDLLAGKLGYRLAETFQTPRLFPWLSTPALDYPSVNPPIRVFVPEDGGP